MKEIWKGTREVGHIFDAMVQFFQDDSWSLQQVEGKPVLLMNATGQNGTFNCMAVAKEDDHGFTFHSYYPIKVPKDKRQAAAEFFTRANYGLWKEPTWRTLAALVDLALPVAAIRFIPLRADSPWSLLRVYVPYVTAWMAAFCSLSLLKGLVRLLALRRTKP